MIHAVEAHGAVYDHPGKGHDRLFLDEVRDFYGVLDGAGGDELSDAAAHDLPTIISRHQRVRSRSAALFMSLVAADLDTLPERHRRKSTAALACTQATPAGTEVTYFNAGDSSLYLFDSRKPTIALLAHTATSYMERDGRTYIDVAEFLGAGRHAQDLAASVGQLVLPRSSEWTLVGVTDGVQDDDGQGIQAAELEDIIRHTSAELMPDKILSAVDKYDDASVFVVSHMVER